MNTTIFEFWLYISSLIGIFIAGWILMHLINYLVDRSSAWVEKHEKVKIGITNVKAMVISKVAILTDLLKNGLIIVFSLWILIAIGGTIVETTEKNKNRLQQRQDFLETNCYRVDIGYEVLSNGKAIYKCPNGKEYKE